MSDNNTLGRRGKKVSQLTAQTSYQSGDLINIVRNGTNYKIDASNLAAFLGVTGTLVPVGGSGAPILEQPSTALNRIRNLESGLGTTAFVTSQNGVKINHNFPTGTPKPVRKLHLSGRLIDSWKQSCQPHPLLKNFQVSINPHFSYGCF